MTPIRAGILVVSDTVSLNQSVDVSGPTIIEMLQARGCDSKMYNIVPDDESRIKFVVKMWCDSGDIDWIITTGGTGFGVRDRTPEAITPLLERQAPGLVHLLLSSSLEQTPFAALSRPVAGTIKNTLVVTLPGSVKAVKENLEALFADGVIEHAIDLIRGGTGKRVHASLAASAPHEPVTPDYPNKCHHHDSHEGPRPSTMLSHDPSLPVSARHRVSPFPLVSFEDAIEIIMEEVKPLGIVSRLVDASISGMILAKNVYATEDIPVCPTSNVDGYAIRGDDRAGVYSVVTATTHPLAQVLPAGAIYRINTGCPLPSGTNAVIMVEDTRLIDTIGVEEKQVETLAHISAGENVRAPGSDTKKGVLLLEQYDTIRSGHIGTLVFIGRKEVDLYRKPIVALFSTGSEIVDIQAPSRDGGGFTVLDANRPALQAELQGSGYEVIDLGIVPDNVDDHVAAIKKGLAMADLLLTTGGTSMGVTDFLKPVIERHFNGTIHFGRVAVKPGKPTTFATIPIKGVAKPIFALPGNPASALVTFHVFVVPALRKLAGYLSEACQLPRVRVKAQTPMPLDLRTEFHRVFVAPVPDGLVAFSTGGQRSSRMPSMSGANALAILPKRKEHGPEKIQAGEYVEAIVIGEIESA